MYTSQKFWGDQVRKIVQGATDFEKGEREMENMKAFLGLWKSRVKGVVPRERDLQKVHEWFVNMQG